MSAQNSGPNTKDNSTALNVALTVFGLFIAIILGVMAFPDQVSPVKHLLAVTALGLILIGAAVFLIKLHDHGRLLGYITLAFGIGFIVYAAVIGYGLYRGTGVASSNGSAECSDYYNRKQYQQAIDCYKKAGNIDQDFKAKMQLGLSYLALEKYEEAATVLKDIFSQNPNEIRPHISKAYYELAMAAARRGDIQQAVRYKTILRTYDPAMADRVNI